MEEESLRRKAAADLYAQAWTGEKIHRSPVEVGSLSHYLQVFFTSQVVVCRCKGNGFRQARLHRDLEMAVEEVGFFFRACSVIFGFLL